MAAEEGYRGGGKSMGRKIGRCRTRGRGGTMGEFPNGDDKEDEQGTIPTLTETNKLNVGVHLIRTIRSYNV